MKALLIVIMVICFSWADHDDDVRHFPKDLSYLDLDREQYLKVKEIVHEYKRDLIDFRFEKRMYKRAVGDLYLQGDFDAERYETMSQELEKRAIDIQSDFLKKLHAILTPWQRERFLYYFDEWDVN